MNNCAQPDQHSPDRRQDFEGQVVRKIMRHIGQIGLLGRFKAERQAECGSRQLTLDWFHRKYPTFPVRLGAVLLADSRPPPWPDVFLRLMSSGFFKAYRRWCEEQDIDDHQEHVGLVFNLGPVTFVLHNFDRPAKGHATGIIRVVGKPPVTFVLEEFKSLLDTVGSDWARND